MSEACIGGHLGCGDLFYPADPRTLSSRRETKTERTTMRGGNGTPYLLLACAHLSMGREFGICVECVLMLILRLFTPRSWLRGACVWGVDVWRRPGVLREQALEASHADHG